MATTAEWLTEKNLESEAAQTPRRRLWPRASARSPHAGGWTLSRKLTVTLVLTWVAIIAIVFSMALQNRSGMIAERKANIRDVVGMISTRLQGYQAQVQAGDLSPSEAKQRAITAIAAMHFGADRQNYFFVVDDDTRVVYHPRRDPGADMTGYTDPSGTPIYQEFVATGKQKKQGFVTTVSQRSKTSAYLDKLCYIEYFAPWGWSIGAGVYLDDIQAAFYDRLTQYAVVLLLVGGLMTLVFWLLRRSVYRSLGGEPRDAEALVDRIANGNLNRTDDTHAQDRHGLMGAIERMRSQLSDMVDQIRRSSEAIDTGASEIASRNNDLSSRTEEQAASLEQTAASMEQITATVRQNADNANQASGLSNQTASSAAEGQAVIGRVVSTMQEIRDSSEEISKIITLIDEIAFQTNLLALNAAVEAARAGEHGRGFAVVASEVRQLASRSADAADNIKSLISRSVGHASTGTQLVGEAESAINDIHASAERVNQLMADISSASNEQTAGIEQVGQAITQMDEVTQQNAALVDESATASTELENRAGELREAIERFQVAALV